MAKEKVIVKPGDGEGDLCDLILRHAHLLTCYNCGAKLSDKVQVNDDRVGVLRIDPGRNNYPREPDEPAVAYFECIECNVTDSSRTINLDGSSIC